MYLPLSSAFPGELPTGLHVYHLYLNAPGTPSASRLGSPPRTFLSSALPEEMHVLFPSLPLSLTLATSSPSPLTLGSTWLRLPGFISHPGLVSSLREDDKPWPVQLLTNAKYVHFL